METNRTAPDMLDLMVHPGFCVKDGKIVKANAAALGIMVSEGADIQALLHTGQEEYAAFSGGCLYLTLEIAGVIWGASVTRMGEYDIFLPEQDAEQPQLQALALAATELRGPLAGLLSIADSLQPIATDPKSEQQLALLNQRLYQLHRLVNNMSDAKFAGMPSPFGQEIFNVCAMMEELFEKAAPMAAHTGITLHFSAPIGSIFTMGEPQKLERAVWNVLSNALKFTPKGGTIEAALKQRGKRLYLTVTDSGSGIAEQIRGSLYQRYTRQPGIEDSRFGLGLGMVLIRSAAACHGGTVLIDQPTGTGTRVTLTMEIRQDTTGKLRTPVMRVDYAGELDHALIELSDCLPPELYASKNLK